MISHTLLQVNNIACAMYHKISLNIAVGTVGLSTQHQQ